MQIHKEGKIFVRGAFLLFLFTGIISIWIYTKWYMLILTAIAFILFGIILRFFRVPQRSLNKNKEAILAPADGTIVAIEAVEEPEYFKDKRLQVSIFMSLNNVHINWVPISGIIEYFNYHKGKYLVAFHPKSSTKNERTTVVVNDGKHQILFRQIAGYIARRIVWYANEGDYVEQNDQFGFIKFGSRVDLFLPLDTVLEVTLNQKVTGTETVIAYLK